MQKSPSKRRKLDKKGGEVNKKLMHKNLKEAKVLKPQIKSEVEVHHNLSRDIYRKKSKCGICSFNRNLFNFF